MAVETLTIVAEIDSYYYPTTAKSCGHCFKSEILNSNFKYI